MYGWLHTAEPKGHHLPRAWSIVIAARNEAETLALPPVINSFQRSVLSSLDPAYQSWNPRYGPPERGPYEVILVDDHSTDSTAAIARRYPHVNVLVLPEGLHGKKAALTYGIEHATGNWIATIDADVFVREDWLRQLDAATTGRVAVAAPVQLRPRPEASWFQRWQALDFCGMMLITAGSIHHDKFVMGNGANLAFAKTAYEAVGGYESPDGRESASGDDMVLLGKLAERFPGRVTFAKDWNAIAYTSAQSTPKGFIRQRWRWSAKTGLNHQPVLTAVLGFTWVFHVGLLVGVPLAMAGYLLWSALGVAWMLKLVIDWALLREATGFFGQRRLLDWTYPLQSFVHTLYVAGIGTLALLPIDYEWKGRRWRV